MTIKTVLCPVSGSDGDMTALAAALSVARRFEAHVEVLHVAGDPRDAVPFLGEGASGALVEQIMTAAAKDISERASRARSTYDAWRAAANLVETNQPLAAPGPSTSWRQETGAEDEWVARRGRLHDVTTVAPPKENVKVAWTLVFEAALLDSGRPVMIVPAGLNGVRLADGPIMIGWNGSAQATRAVAAAMPFMVASSRIVVVSVKDRHGSADPEDLVGYLAWRGLKAEGRRVEAKTAAIGATLLAEAEGAKCDLAVMGAYTHTRVREMIFGGVTRHVLENTKLPILMAR